MNTKMSQAQNQERMPMFHQSWEPVILRNRELTQKRVNATQQTDKTTGQRISNESQMMRKLAAADGPVKPKRLTPESKQQMINLRVANSWSQADLNMRCGFPVNTIREIEAGRLCPNPGMLNVLNRVLKCGLRYQ